MTKHILSGAAGAIGRRRFLAASAGILPAALLGCGREPAAAQPPSEPLHAAAFRARGLSDRQVLERAFTAWVARGGGTLHLERDHVYDLGFQDDGSNVFVVFGLVDAVLAGNGATLRVHSRLRGQYFNLLYLAHYRNLRIENLRCLDTGYLGWFTEGAKFIVLDAGERDSVNLTLDNVAGEGLVSFVHIQGLPQGPRVRGVRIMPNCRATRVFYVLACLDNGDDVTGGYSTFNCARSYFPSGVTGHNLVVRIDHQGASHGPTAETAIPIKSYGRPTSGIRLDVTFSGVLASTGSCVTMEHQHAPSAPPSVIENVDLRIDIAPGTADPGNIPRLVLRSYLPDNSLQRGPTNNIWRRIRLSGNLRPGAGPTIVANVEPEEIADISIAPGTIGADARFLAAPGFRIRRSN